MKTIEKYLITAMLLITAALHALTLTAQGNQIKPSVHYKLKANGKNILVYDAPVASYSIMEISGKTEIEIRANQDVKWVDIRPRNLNTRSKTLPLKTFR